VEIICYFVWDLQVHLLWFTWVWGFEGSIV